MKKYILTTTVIVMAITYYLLSEPMPGEIVETFEITEGGLGDYTIGIDKESLLMKLNDQSYSPAPKNQNCQKNWVEVATMNRAEKQCLMISNNWQVGGNIESPCPTNTDYFVSLSFINNAISKIEVKCSKPK